jgi:hypothetical protein
MKARYLASLPMAVTMLAAQVSPQHVKLAEEPHHKLLLENAETRVFRLTLARNEATLLHRHPGFYAFISIGTATIQNEVPGHKPVVTELSEGDLHTSKGGFSLIERNISSNPAELIVIERVRSPGAPFQSPMGAFRIHDAALGELFDEPFMRAYTLRLAAGGRTEAHDERYDRLIVAVTDLHLEDALDGPQPKQVLLKRGEVQWIPHGSDHAITNTGTEPCTFITIEFN